MKESQEPKWLLQDDLGGLSLTPLISKFKIPSHFFACALNIWVLAFHSRMVFLSKFTQDYCCFRSKGVNLRDLENKTSELLGSLGKFDVLILN